MDDRRRSAPPGAVWRASRQCSDDVTNGAQTRAAAHKLMGRPYLPTVLPNAWMLAKILDAGGQELRDFLTKRTGWTRVDGSRESLNLRVLGSIPRRLTTFLSKFDDFAWHPATVLPNVLPHGSEFATSSPLSGIHCSGFPAITRRRTSSFPRRGTASSISVKPRSIRTTK